MADIGVSLVTAFDFVWERCTGRLAGLDDDEYFWEPVADCWNLRADEAGRWVLDGGGGGGPAPDPAPITTIAWRIGHVVGVALGGFTDRLFAEGTRSRDDIVFAGTAAAVPEFLDHHYQPWRDGMLTMTDDGWWAALGPTWGPFAEANATDVALHVFDELAHHTAEIALLRDLYAQRDALGSAK